MFKHPKCGGRHETILQAKECETNAKFAAETEAGHAEFLAADQAAEEWLDGATEKMRSAHASSPILASMRSSYPAAGSVAEAAREFGPINKEAILSKRIDSLMNSGTVRGATEGQLKFLTVLGAERDLAEVSSETLRTLELFAAEVFPNFQQASDAITELKKAPKSIAVRQQRSESRQAWRTLAEATPEGRYALPTGPGQDKPHFYRLSKRNGFIKLQEQASDTLYQVELRNYEEILRAIADFGVEKSGRLYGELIGSCRKCGRTLTDENNPYLAQGYGPDCGAKA